MTIAPAVLILLAIQAQGDRSEHLQKELKSWKAGPVVAQELARLDRQGRAIFRQFRDGKITQLTLIRELARLRITIETLRDWSATNHSDEVPQLVIVIVDVGEFSLLFPRGTKHLPRELTLGEVYPSTPGSSTRWQFLGQRRVTGMRLAAFRETSETRGETQQSR
jgi:hypothetical protein